MSSSSAVPDDDSLAPPADGLVWRVFVAALSALVRPRNNSVTQISLPTRL